MAGLLDRFFGSPDQTQALGLLGIGMMNGGFGNGAAMAMQHLAGADERKIRKGLLDAQLEETRAQTEERRAKTAKEQTALDLARQKREALPTLFRQPGMVGGDAAPQTIGGVPMFSKPLGVTPVQSSPGGLDIQSALRNGYTPEEITALHGLTNLGVPKVARTIKGMGPDGREYEYQVDEFGRPVGQGFAQYRAPIEVAQGDRKTFVDPYNPAKPIASHRVFQSPDSAASVAATIRGQNMTDSRQREMADITREANQTQLVNDPILGPTLVNKGTGLARPAVGLDGKPLGGERAVQGVKDAKDVLGLLNEAEKILPKATNSYTGAGYDLVAGGVFGAATEGAKATAQLKALQGALVAKMPKMSGPQSDKDVQLYREMAGQIGDPTIPAATRQAAIDTIRKLNEKYAGVPEGSSKPAPPQSVAPTLRWDPKTRTLVPVVR